MGYDLFHSLTWLNPDEPSDQQHLQRVYEGDIPVLIDYTKPIQYFRSAVNVSRPTKLHFFCDFKFWGYNPEEADAWLTFTASLDPLFNLIELYLDWENQLVHTITRVTIPIDPLQHDNFHVSNIVHNSNNPDDVSEWFSLPKAHNWDNHMEGEGSAPHIFIHLKMEAPPFFIRTPHLFTTSLPEIISQHQFRLL